MQVREGKSAQHKAPSAAKPPVAAKAALAPHSKPDDDALAKVKIDPKDVPAGFQPPDDKAIGTIHTKLEKGTLYPKKDNPVRLESIQYLARLYLSLVNNCHPHIAKIFAGGIYKVLMDIDSENYTWSGLFGLYKKACGDTSDLSKSLKKELHINVDQYDIIANKHRLVCLHALSKYESTDFQHKPDEAKQIITYRKQVENELKPAIDELLSRPPTEAALNERFATISDEYIKLISQDSYISTLLGSQEKHKQYAQFFKMLNDEKLHEVSHLELGEKDKQAISVRVATRYAALLFVRRRILAELNFLQRNLPTALVGRSRLLKLCEEALNLEESSTIPYPVQRTNIFHLASKTSLLAHNKQALEIIEKYFPHAAKQTLDELTAELEEELPSIRYEEKYSNSSTLVDFFTWIARFGIGFLSGSIVASSFPMLTAGMLSQGAAIVGYIYWGNDGKRAFQYVGEFIENQILGNAANVINTVLNPAGTAFGYVAGGVVGIAISKTADGFRLIGFNPKVMLNSDKPDQAYIDTLYEVLPEKQAQKLARVTEVSPHVLIGCPEFTIPAQQMTAPKGIEPA